MESRIRREVYVRFAGELSRNLLRKRSKARGNLSHYDAAEGLLTSVILLIAEFAPPEQGHIVSVFKLIQDLLSTGGSGGKNQFQTLIELLPPDHKTRWFAGGCAQFQQSGDGEHYVNGDVPVKCVSRYRV